MRKFLATTTFSSANQALGIAQLELDAIAQIGQGSGYQPSTDGYGRFIADGVLVPGILLSNYHPRVKIGMAAGVFGLARVSDYCAGTMASTEMSMLLRPNTWDAVGVTGFALSPFSGKSKAIGIAVTLGLGRGYNLIARARGWDGFKDSAESLDSDLAKVRDLDSTTQTRGSFDRSVEKAKQLGLSNPGVLKYRKLEGLVLLPCAGMSKLNVESAHVCLQTSVLNWNQMRVFSGFVVVRVPEIRRGHER